tara:strand:- start:952 stop:1218 length:267 start_codon:yes stop_codon:yes gene_type:complete
MKQTNTKHIKEINEASDLLLYQIARQETDLLAPEILLAALQMYAENKGITEPAEHIITTALALPAPATTPAPTTTVSTIDLLFEEESQ